MSIKPTDKYSVTKFYTREDDEDDYSYANSSGGKFSSNDRDIYNRSKDRKGRGRQTDRRNRRNAKESFLG